MPRDDAINRGATCGSLSLSLLFGTGISLLLAGVYLLTLGGSGYYAITGALILVSAWLVLRRDKAGIQLLWLILLGTVIWSLWEVGLDGWA